MPIHRQCSFLKRLLRLCFEPLDAFGSGQILRHGSAEFFDGLANFRPHFAMGPVGFAFADDLFPAQLFLRLCGAEKIRGQFGATHVVEDLLAPLQTFPGVDVLRSEPVVEAL